MEETVVSLKNLKPPVEEPEMTAFDQSIIGKAIRIEIPFSDLYKMREIADLLRGLAEEIDFQARRTDHPPMDSRNYVKWRRSTLFMLKQTAWAVNRRIRELHGKANKNGTTR